MRLTPLAVTAWTAALLAMVPVAGAAPPIVEIPVDPGPSSITSGADGALWVAHPFPDPGGLSRITTDGLVTRTTAGPGGFVANMRPDGIALGGDGALYFAQTAAAGSAIQRRTAAGVFESIPTPSLAPFDVAAGPGGTIWYTVPGGVGFIGRITGAGPAIEFEAGKVAGFTANKQPYSITAGPDGAMWFTEASAPGKIGRISAAGAVTEYALPLAGARSPSPRDIVAGPDGALWFTDPGTRTIGRITTSGTLTSFSTGLAADAAPEGITAGPDGAVWFTDQARGLHSVGRITTAGAITTFSFGMTPGSEPKSIVTGSDDHLWFTETSAGRVGRIAAPPAVSLPAAQATVGGAQLTGRVDANGSLTSYRFEYGPTAAYGKQTDELSVGRSKAPVDVMSALSGLPEGEVVHVRLRAVNDAGESVSDGITVTTAKAPPAPGPGPGPVAGPLPTPELGKNVVVWPAVGSIRVRNKGEKTWYDLAAHTGIPVGSVVDASKGRVGLSSALDAAGKTQSGVFWDGFFTIKQKTTKKGLTDIYLWGGDFGPCKAKRARKAGAAIARTSAKRSKKKVRSLWSQDKGGRFRTHGHDSIATVRGTEWFTQDRCDGTLTKVKEGSVSVDPKRGKTRVVKAGQSFLARRR